MVKKNCRRDNQCCWKYLQLPYVDCNVVAVFDVVVVIVVVVVTNVHPFQCHAHLSSHHQPRTIACCYDGEYCNRNVTLPGYNKQTPNDRKFETKLSLLDYCRYFYGCRSEWELVTRIRLNIFWKCFYIFVTENCTALSKRHNDKTIMPPLEHFIIIIGLACTWQTKILSEFFVSKCTGHAYKKIDFQFLNDP